MTKTMGKHNRSLVTLLLFISLLSCKKETETFSVTYIVEASPYSYAEIEWTTKDGAISGGKLENIGWTNEGTVSFGSSHNKWTYSYTGQENLRIYFTGLTASSFYKVNIQLYVNGKLIQSAESSSNLKAKIQYAL